MVCTVVYFPNKGLFFLYIAYFLIEWLILLEWFFYSDTGLFYKTLVYFLTQWLILLPISLFSYFLRVWSI
jgi:hypothetical protein